MKLEHLFLAAVLGCLVAVNPTHQQQQDAAEVVCKTPECAALAEDILHHSINESNHPCDDFYEYICGNWGESHPIPEGKSSINSFSIRNSAIQHEINDAVSATVANPSATHAAKYAAQLYLECNSTETIEKRGVAPLLDLIHSVVGYWPLLRQPVNGSTIRDWRQLFVDLYAKAALSPVFSIGIRLIQEKKYLGIAPNGIGLPPQFFQAFPPERLAIYKDYIQSSAILLGAPNDTQLAHDVEEVFQLEHDITWTLLNASRKFPSAAKIESFSKLDYLSENGTDWLVIVNQILKAMGSKLPPFEPYEEVQVQLLDGLNEAAEILDHTKPEVIQNLFAWIIAMQFGGHTTEEFRKNEADFHFHIQGVQNELAHWEFCYTQVNSRLPLAMSEIYVDSHSSPSDKKEAEILVHEIKQSLRGVLETNTWLDNETRQFALEKLDATRDNVAYPEAIENAHDMDDFIYVLLKGVDVMPGKYFESLLQASRINTRINFDHFPFPFNKSLAWPITPSTVNAAYLPSENSITIPASVLKTPFFDASRPLAMNYGAIGQVIGHEYTHGFDNNGRNYDQDGHPKNWWTFETTQQFQERAKCMIDQYSAVVDPVANQTVNGRQTIGENIADNGGIKESFAAFRAHEAKYGKSTVLPGLNFTADQLFFVSYAHLWCNSIKPEALKQQMRADPHSPNRARVNVVLGNLPEFAQAFNCPANSTMNPDIKCAVW